MLGVTVRRREKFEVESLSICTNLRLCYVSGTVFFAIALRWF